MASIANLFRRLTRGRPGTVRECRRCGTTVESSADECPACDATDIATYQLTG